MKIDFSEQKLNLPKPASEFEAEILQFIGQWFNSQDFITVQTSGSTGSPKILNLSKKAMMFSARQTLSFLELIQGDTALLALPVRYIAGKMMIVRAIVGKMKLLCIEPHFNLQIPKEKIDFAAFIPAQMQNLLNTHFNFSNIKKIILGGAAISTELKAKIKNLQPDIYATYGMTETITHIALQRLSGRNASDYFELLPQIQIGVYDNDKLWIKTPYFIEKIYTTDRVVLLAENKFRWLGRADNVINSGGLKIQPEEIENALHKIINKPFFVTGLADDFLGQKLVVFIEDTDNAERKNVIKQKLSDLLPKAKLPREIFFVDKFVYTSTMKIDRMNTIKDFFLK